MQIRDEIISSSDVPRGMFGNEDTGWSIESTSKGIDETAAKNGKWSPEYHALTSMEDLIRNAVLLDTVTVDNPSKKLGSNTLFVHHFYVPVVSESGKGIAKLYVSENPESKKFYLLKIEKAPADSTGSVNADPNSSTDATISVAEIFDFVKRNDRAYEKDSKSPIYFEPKEVNPLMLNEDGSPKVFYHGTFENWTAYDLTKNVNQQFGDGIYLTESRERARLYGDNIMPLYVRALHDYRSAKENGVKKDYSITKNGDLIVYNPNQIKSATDNIGTFNGNDPDIRFSLPENEPAAGRFLRGGGNAKYALTKAETDKFAHQIDNLHTIPSNEALIVCGTPQVFLDIGLNKLPMTLNLEHAKDAVALNPNHQDRFIGKNV